MTRRRLMRAALCVSLLAVPAAAVAASRTILDTTRANTQSFRYGNFIVVGAVSRTIRTGPVTSGRFIWETTEQLPLAPGTLFVIPMLSGWQLAYGEPIRNGHRPNPTDHHWGEGIAQVEVVALDLRRVSVRVRMWLVDWNRDDRWWGEVQYNLLFLGPARTTPTSPGEEEEQEPG